ncbi:unnamed protein product [Prorocentrum cordatum]|nr:unnamed protein product [Polarella glacialis]
MENYFESQRETIFQDAKVLIYVVVAVNDRAKGTAENIKDYYFHHAMDSLRQFSPKARVFCLIHKLDLVHESKRDEVLKRYEQDLRAAAPGQNVTCFGTSIWDETLFKAWSQIVNSLIPEIDQLSSQLEHICRVCEADEVVLFEKNTFLLISHSSRRCIEDSHRFEKISNIVKQFKLSCGKVKTSFRSFQVKNSLFSATIEPFLQHSFVMVVVSDPQIHSAAVAANLWAARTGPLRRALEAGRPLGRPPVRASHARARVMAPFRGRTVGATAPRPNGYGALFPRMPARHAVVRPRLRGPRPRTQAARARRPTCTSSLASPLSFCGSFSAPRRACAARPPRAGRPASPAGAPA